MPAESLLKRLALGAAAAFALTFVVVATLRLSYPYDLEWMEGGVVDTVARVLAGAPIYVEPTVDFVPYIYTPLYYYVAAAVSKVLGAGYTAPRLVSFAAILICAAILFSWGRREAKSRVAGAMAAGLFLATYRVSGYFFDLARVDSLAVCFLLGGAYVARFSARPAAGALAALLLVLAVFTKQQMLIPSIAVLTSLVWRCRLAASLALGTWGIAMVVAGLGLNAASDGWFRTYALDSPLTHPIVPYMWWRFWAVDVLARLPVMFVAFIVLLRQRKTLWPAETRHVGFPFLVVVFIGVLLSSWAARVHQGGWHNVNMPMHAMLCLACGIATAGVERLRLPSPTPSQRSSASESTTASPSALKRLERLILVSPLLVWGAWCLQFAHLGYLPWKQVPTRETRTAVSELLDIVRAQAGDVWVISHGFVSPRAGKPTYAHAMAVDDILRSPGVQHRGREVKALMAARLDSALTACRFAALIVDSETLWVPIKRNYETKLPLFSAAEGDSDRGPRTVCGYPTWPDEMWLPSPEAPRDGSATSHRAP